MIKYILSSVQSALKERVPDLRYIAEDWGQLDFYREKPPVNFPCALIGFSSGEYSDSGQGQQLAKIEFTVSVTDMPLVRGSAARPDSEQSFDSYELLQKVYRTLQGLGDDCFAPVTRKRLMKISRDDGLREWIFTFQTAFLDNDAIKIRDRR